MFRSKQEIRRLLSEQGIYFKNIKYRSERKDLASYFENYPWYHQSINIEGRTLYFNCNWVISKTSTEWLVRYLSYFLLSSEKTSYLLLDHGIYHNNYIITTANLIKVNLVDYETYTDQCKEISRKEKISISKRKKLKNQKIIKC